ncbi:MAG: zf-TFIIB domain-containing protein [Candidatus Marinimicrobia bacterium]|nr:zf-TFIIB domain-containing protein [Candidatus Neomarinimicrobiota bacterium]
MDCPKCKMELLKKSIQGIEVDECNHCEGIWFDNDELRLIKDKIDSDLNWMDFDIWKHPEKFKPKSTKYVCPVCESPMNVLDYDKTEVEIDYCTTCKGIWLDKNELQNIIDSLEEEILTKSMSEYLKATIDEAKELITGPELFLSEWKDFSTILRFLQYRIITNHPAILDVIVGVQKNPLNR